MCINITGEGCGYKAADSAPKRRLASDGSTGNCVFLIILCLH